MFNFEQLAGLEHFKKCIANICEEDIASVSATIYNCMKLFKSQYEDTSNWMRTSLNQSEWFDYLAALVKDILVKEINQELPFGTTNGVYMALLFFKAVATNEDSETIGTMADYLDKFYRIGQQVSNKSDMQNSFFINMNQQCNAEILVH